jgi:hypothetical protein
MGLVDSEGISLKYTKSLFAQEAKMKSKVTIEKASLMRPKFLDTYIVQTILVVGQID